MATCVIVGFLTALQQRRTAKVQAQDRLTFANRTWNRSGILYPYPVSDNMDYVMHVKLTL